MKTVTVSSKVILEEEVDEDDVLDEREEDDDVDAVEAVDASLPLRMALLHGAETAMESTSCVSSFCVEEASLAERSNSKAVLAALLLRLPDRPRKKR